MNTIFPFGFPLPTILYLVLYVVTLAIHVVFMNYVIAGCLYLAFACTCARRDQRCRPSPIAGVLRDWMPLILSAAITAGVAPLLFVQILYKINFYTANLLLFHRWMAILPALIVGFYLVYLLKSKHIEQWPAWARAVVGFGALACFAFTGYSWTENHLLSLQGQAVWTSFYNGRDLFFHSPQLLPRLGMWVVGGFPTMAIFVAWQLWYQGRGDESFRAQCAGAGRSLATLALAGMIVALLCGLGYALQLTPAQRVPLVGNLAGVYLAVGAVGVLLQLLGWGLVLTRDTLRPRLLTLLSIGCGLTILGMTVVREGIRLQAIDITQLYRQHADILRAGGIASLVVFLFFFVLNGVLVGWCFQLVRQGRTLAQPK